MHPPTLCDSDDNASSAAPLVLVEGFLSYSSRRVWGPVESLLNQTPQRQRRPVLLVSVGPFSSLHDRACELYYALKGGTVDYGQEHAAQHGHERFGRSYEHGLYPCWSTTRPLHFLGHSMGGNTILKLINLLDNKFFGPGCSAEMILSVITVSAPLRGTPLVYLLGQSLTGVPAVRPFSVGAFLARHVHFFSYFEGILPSPFDFHADSRRLSFRHSSFLSFLSQLWRSSWAESRDALPWDATFEASDIREALGEGSCYPSIYYRSYQTGLGDSVYRPRVGWFGLLREVLRPYQLMGRWIAQFDIWSIRPNPGVISRRSTQISIGAYSTYHGKNDGVVPEFSQWHPLDCSETTCIHDIMESGEEMDKFNHSNNQSPKPGQWYVRIIPDSHHLSLAPSWRGTKVQVQFWAEVRDWVEKIDGLI